MNTNLPRDLQAAQQAQPQEQAYQDSNPFLTNGVGFQGSPEHEQFQIGQDYQGLAPIDELSLGVGIGVESGQEGLMRDAMAGMLDPTQPFPNVVPGYEVGGFDAMRGITYPAVPAELSNESMYLIGGRAVSAGEYYGQANQGPGNTDE